MQHNFTFIFIYAFISRAAAAVRTFHHTAAAARAGGTTKADPPPAGTSRSQQLLRRTRLNTHKREQSGGMGGPTAKSLSARSISLTLNERQYANQGGAPVGSSAER